MRPSHTVHGVGLVRVQRKYFSTVVYNQLIVACLIKGCNLQRFSIK